MMMVRERESIGSEMVKQLCMFNRNVIGDTVQPVIFQFIYLFMRHDARAGECSCLSAYLCGCCG